MGPGTQVSSDKELTKVKRMTECEYVTVVYIVGGEVRQEGVVILFEDMSQRVKTRILGSLFFLVYMFILILISHN